MSELTEAGLQLVKDAESLRLDSYQDSAGVWTIGYGHTLDVHPGQHISTADADRFLDQDLAQAKAAVSGAVHVPLTDNQFSALVSFVFNVGADQFLSSTLLQKLNAGDYSGAADELLRWTHAGGVELPGLVTRRQRERTLFLSGASPEPPSGPPESVQGVWRLYAPPEDYHASYTLQSPQDRELIAWIARRLGLRHSELPEGYKVFLGLALPSKTVQMVPLQQSNEVSCGQTCVAMCVNALTGKHVTDQDVNQRYGFSLLAALNAECQPVGYPWVDGGDLTPSRWPQLEGILQQGLPIILGLNGPEFSPSGRGHIIALTAVHGDQVTFADPAIGKFRIVTKDDILNAPPHPDGKFFFYPIDTKQGRTP